MEPSRSAPFSVAPWMSRRTELCKCWRWILAKQSFHVHGVSADGKIVSRRVGRHGLPTLVDKLDPEVVAMEACATAHYWGRLFMASGRQVRLINPHFVRPFMRGSKNDAVDAEAT